ncbi:hypothetical protein [Actinomadura sp. 7K507]|uniref:hypothetical protein n=1 Tax=Actinomadura sp. 7K507 TaxID=2530365 RepID=UPI00104E0856|nr:hypothetical protein [Actinomadura sp. 7K507]TDC73731.1 hypothetical protein E1285_44340 [Actinomadura sp. 7K507]
MRPGPAPDWAPLSMRRWVARDLHRTLTTAIDHLEARHAGTTGHLTGTVLDDLRYHAGLLRCRLAESAAGNGTMTDKDPIR